MEIQKVVPFKCDSTMILNKFEAATAPSTDMGLLSASRSCVKGT